MAEHLTLVSLRRALSARAGVSEKVADDFLNALTGSIQEGLQNDGSVTINGLGSFNIQDVPARESVNVATGERFTIEGYKKVAFTAGNIAENRKSDTPRHPLEIKDDIDPIQKLGEQAEEIKDILSELSTMSTDSTQDSESPVVPIIPVIPAVQEVQEAPVSAEQAEEPATPRVPDTPASAEQPKEESKKPFNPWLTGLITIGVFAMLLVIAYFILRHQIVNWADGMRSSIEQRVSDQPSAISNQQSEIAMPEAEPAQPTETRENTEPAQSAAQPLSPWFDDNQRKFKEFLPAETMGKDSRLAWVAKKRYGEKAYWVFIYEVNRDRLKSPDFVLAGMTIRVPKLPKELSNINDPNTKALLDRLSDKYLNNR